MAKWKHCITGLVLALATLLPCGVCLAQGQGAVVDGILFFSETCPHCEAVLSEFLPAMREKYGSQINIQLASVSDITNYLLLQQLDELYGVPSDQRGVPELFIGSSVMVGRYSIEQNFEAVVDAGLAQGGIDMGSLEALREQVAAAVATHAAEASPTAAPQGSPTAVSQVAVTTTAVATSSAMPEATVGVASPVIHMAYLIQPGCEECDRVGIDLSALEQMNPTLVVERYAVAENGALAEWLGEHYGVPTDKRLVAPAVFVGDDYLIGEEVTAEALAALVQKYTTTGAARVWDNWEASEGSAQEQVVERFRSFGLLTLLAAGLIDGVNPCAFATILFFISYLALTGRGRKQIVSVGIAFTLGVFVTYMLLGLGLYQVAAYMTGAQIAAKVLYGLTAGVCLVFAVLSLYDFAMARRGRAEEMQLKLPTRLRLFINRSIRDTMKPGATALAAALAGAVVSSVELVCTGQVYLPTIMFVASRPELKLSAIGSLAVYNVAFVTPLIIVFGFAGFGSGSERLRLLLSRHTSTLKLLTALVLFGLAAWLASLLF